MKTETPSAVFARLVGIPNAVRLRPGTNYSNLLGDRTGTVLRLRALTAAVAFGSFHVNVPFADLEPVEQGQGGQP